MACGVADEVHGAIESHRAHTTGKQVCIDRTQIGAVGDTVVGELVVTDGSPQQFEVSGRVDGRDVLQ
jgi:hypothetical protein